MKCSNCEREFAPHRQPHRIREDNGAWLVYCEDCMIEYAPVTGTMEEWLS